MAIVLKPPQRRLIPVGPVKIDWSHPLTNGLIAAYVPAISEGINLTGMGGNLSRINPVNIAAASAEGPGIKTAIAGDGFKGLAPPSFLGPANSYYWRGVYTSSISNVVLLGIQYSDPEGAPYLFQSVNCSGTTTNLECLWNTGGGFVNGTATAFPTGVMMSALGTFSNTGGHAILYKNGVAVITDTMGASAPTSSATSTICFQSSTADITRDIVALGNVGYIWNRQLSADEAAALDADPYAFLIPAEGEMPALQPSGSTPPFIPNSNDNFNVRQLAQRAAAVALLASQPFVPFNTAQVTPTVAKGWQHIQARAAPIAKAQPTQPTSFAVPASAAVTPSQFGWYQPLAGAPAVAKASPGHSTVPFNTAQVSQVVVKGWYGQTSTAVKVATAWPMQPTQFAVPASVAPPAQTPGQFGWWANLSKSAPVAQAKPGNTFVPFNTAQVVISPQTVPLNYDAGSVQSRVVYYQANFQVLRPVAITPNTITGIAWFQPLGISAPVAQAKPGSTFVPFNTTQITNTVTAFGWYQPLSVAAKIATAQQGNTFVPFNTRQINSIVGIGWYQNLSRPAPVAIAQAGFSFVPFNTKQVVTVQVAFDPFVKKRSKPKRDRLRDELEIKYKRRLAIEEAFWPPTTYELPPYKLPEQVKPAPDVSDLANVIMQVQQMRAAQAKQQDEEDEKALLELLRREYGIEDV